MTIMQIVLAYLLECHPELLAYQKVEDWKYKDPQLGLQN
ncbi:hypothetical protein ES703_120794 [subsurface metagenome]